MTSNRQSKEHERLLEGLRKNRPVLRHAVDNTVLKFERLLDEYDPLQVISDISRQQLLKDPETYAESIDTSSEPLVEYVMSLALSKLYPAAQKAPTTATMDAVSTLWKELTANLSAYFLAELADKTTDPTEAQLRADLLMSYFFRRGPDYLVHVEQTFLELLGPHNLHLLNIVGFSAEDLHAFMRRAEKTINSALTHEHDKLEVILRAHSRFSEWAENSDLQGMPTKDVSKQFREDNPDIARDIVGLDSEMPQHSYDTFEIRPESEAEKQILETLSCQFGENELFLTRSPKWRGWPTNDTVVSSRPIVKVDDKYYIFHLPMAFRSIASIMENLLKQLSPWYYENKYLPSTNKYLERTALRLIMKLLPGSGGYTRLFYDVTEQGRAVRYELDGLVIYDDCLVVIEAKASRIPPQKRRGAIRGFEQSMMDILKKAQEQAVRAIRYINSAPEVTFLNGRGAPLVIIKREQYRHVFIVLVSFEPIYELSCHLPTARRLGLLPGEEWPWFVCINDLRVISEVLEHPSTFIHYLKRRIALNDQPAVHAFDELDYFMRYIETGLVFGDTSPQQVGMLGLSPCTDELDAYYSYLRGERSVAPKPRIKMDPVFEQLISRLETEKPRGFVSTCLALFESSEHVRWVFGQDRD